MKNYGYTVSFSNRGSKKRIRSMAVFRTKREAESAMKTLKATAKAFGASNLRVVKATKKEYDLKVSRESGRRSRGK